VQSEGNEKQLKANVAILRRLRESGNEGDVPSSDYLNHELALASIGIGDYDTAIEILKPEADDEASMSIQDAFNLAMAMWGHERMPPVKMFALVSNKDAESPLDSDKAANYLQCLAITHAALGNLEPAKSFLAEARKRIGSRPAREFSAWSYSKVTPRVFRSHLDEIEKLANGEDVLPKFMLEKVK